MPRLLNVRHTNNILRIQRLYSTQKPSFVSLIGSILVSKAATNSLARSITASLISKPETAAVSNPLAPLIKKICYKQFFGGESITEVAAVISGLSRKNIGFMLDYAVEGEVITGINSIFKDMIVYSQAERSPFKSIAIKLTSVFSIDELTQLSSTAEPLERLQLVREKMLESFEFMRGICRMAAEAHVPIYVDAEWSDIQPGIDYLTLLLATEFNKEFPVVCNTYQMYLKDALTRLRLDLHHLECQGLHFGAKIVRGAYHPFELTKPQPLVFTAIKDSHDQYNDSMKFLFEQRLKGTHISNIVFATHNKQSTELLADLLKLRRTEGTFYLGQLYGLETSQPTKGIPTVYYIPFGPIEKSIPFLLRRLDENPAVLHTYSAYLMDILKTRLKFW